MIIFNKVYKSYIILSLSLLIACFASIENKLNAETLGKVDIGPAILHVDILEFGHTIKTINMPGLRADGTFMIWQGLCLKPSVTYGGKGSTQVFNGGCGLGFYTPIGDKCSITPAIGLGYTEFKTNINYKVAPSVFILLEEEIQSFSPYISLDATYCFYKGWRFVLSYQYVFSYSETKIKHMDTTKSRPKGSNYGFMVEYDLNEKWSLNLGGAYNTSLTKEKHGIRGYGARFGFAYWF